jgi:hypothetical protein
VQQSRQLFIAGQLRGQTAELRSEGVVVAHTLSASPRRSSQGTVSFNARS